MADAHGLGPCTSNSVQVQLLSPALCVNMVLYGKHMALTKRLTQIFSCASSLFVNSDLGLFCNSGACFRPSSLIKINQND